MKGKFGMEMSNMKGKFLKMTHLINYARFVKTSPLRLKFVTDKGYIEEEYKG